MEKTILITGGNGLLGQHLTKVFRDETTFKVIVTGRGEDRLKENGYQYFSMDITSVDEVEIVLKENQPDIIIHSAAISKVEECEDNNENAILNNVYSTELLLKTGKKYGLKHFMFISTDFVFDGEKGMYEETDKRNPPNYYGMTKLMSEDLLFKEKEVEISIVRTCLVYGQVKDMSRTNIMLWAKEKLAKGEIIRVVNDQYRTPTYVGDLAKGCFLIVNKEVTGIFHISGKDYLTPYEIVLKVAEYLTLPIKNIIPVDASKFKEHGRRPLKTGFSNNKAYEKLNYQPISFEDGMKKVLNNVYF